MLETITGFVLILFGGTAATAAVILSRREQRRRSPVGTGGAQRASTPTPPSPTRSRPRSVSTSVAPSQRPIATTRADVEERYPDEDLFIMFDLDERFR